MTIAILLRHMTMGNEAAVWNTRWMCSEDYFHIHERFGVGVVAVLDKTSLAAVAPHCDGLIIPGSATDIPLITVLGSTSMPRSVSILFVSRYIFFSDTTTPAVLGYLPSQRLSITFLLSA